MADGLLSKVLGAIDRQKQTTKAGLGLLFSDPKEFAIQTTARYFPTRDEELQFRAVEQAGGDVTQTPYYQKLFGLAQFQGSIKPVKGLPSYEQAHQIAQKNATEMLGLPPNNTAMDRAKALGFDTDAYHATPQQFNEFKAGGIDPTLSGEAVWLSPYKDYYAAAHNIGGYKGNYVPGTNVLPLKVKIKSPMELDDQGMLDWARDVYAGGSKEFPQLISPQTAKDVKSDYGSILFEGEKLGMGKNTNEMIIFDPKNIRSKFAAFDPARVNEADLLAAGVPLGLIANTKVDIPKKKEKKTKK